MPAERTLSEQELARAVAALPSLADKDVVIYDGHCRFCIAQVKRLVRWAGSPSPLDKQPLQTPGLLEALSISHDDAMKAMHLVTPQGRIYWGLSAVVEALRHRPILGRLLRLYYLPVFKQLGDLGYRLVARYRYMIAGRAVARGECVGSCSIHARPSD